MKNILLQIEVIALVFVAFALAFFRARRKPRADFANIGEGSLGNGIRAYIPDAATTARYLMYKRGTDADHCDLAGAGDTPLGPSDDQAAADSVPIAIQLLGAVRGTVLVTTDGTLSDGQYCTTVAGGKVGLATTGNLAIGIALIPTDSTSASGDVIQMIPVLPSKLSF